MFRRSSIFQFSLFRQTAFLLDIGTVKFWYDPKGYGFVVNEDTKESIFCHNKDCIFAENVGNFRSLQPNQKVRFDVAPDPKSGLRCINVRAQDGNPLPRGRTQPAFLQDRAKFDRRYVLPEPGTNNLRGMISKVVQRDDEIGSKQNSPIRQDSTSLITTHGWITPTEGERTGKIYFHASSLDEKSLQKFKVKYLYDPFWEQKSKAKMQREMNLAEEKEKAAKKRLEEAVQQSSSNKIGGGWASAATSSSSNAGGGWATASTTTKTSSASTQQQEQQQQQKPKKPVVDIPFHPSIPPQIYGAALQFGDEVVFDVRKVPSQSHRLKVRRDAMKRHMRLNKIIAEKVKMEKEGATMSPEDRAKQQALIQQLQDDAQPILQEPKDKWELAAVNVRLVHRPKDPISLKGQKVKGVFRSVYTGEKRHKSGQDDLIAWGYVDIIPIEELSASVSAGKNNNKSSSSKQKQQQQQKSQKENSIMSNQSIQNHSQRFAPVYYELTKHDLAMQKPDRRQIPTSGMPVEFDLDVEELKISCVVGELRKQILRERKAKGDPDVGEIPSEESILIKKSFCANMKW